MIYTKTGEILILGKVAKEHPYRQVGTYDNMPKITLIYSVFGDTLEHDTLSTLIGIQPSRKWHMGDPLPSYPTKTRPDTAWVLELEPLDGWDVTILLKKLTEILSPVSKELGEYIDKEHLESQLDVVAEMTPDNKPALYFPVEFIELAGRLRMAIDIDQYIYEPKP